MIFTKKNHTLRKNTMEYLRLKKEILESKMAFKHPFKIENTTSNNATKKKINQTIKINDTPCITVALLTHNRTNVACATIDHLVKNLKYPNLKWCISDDRSTDKNHVEILVQRFLKNNIRDVKVLRTDDEHYGLGASMNNALKYAWTNGDIILTMEDDWILQKELDLTYYAKILREDENVSLIRLCYIDQRHILEPYNENLDSVRQSTNNFIFNNQCGLRHKRIYDFLGYNKENCNGDDQEKYIRDRYNDMTNFGETYKVLWPNKLKKDSMDDPSLYFVHVGKSVSGHGWYDIPARYKWIYQEKWINEVNSMVNNNEIFFRVIIPTYNTTKYIRRCLDSINNQTFKRFKAVIVDDNSDDQKLMAEICKKYDFVEYVQLNEHIDAGGCRNVGLKYFTTSKYTLFCDSDDYYIDNDAFLKLYNHIIENKYPECVNFSFYWEQLHKKQEPCQLEVPWSRCIKTPLCKTFRAYRRKQNDVIWYLRQFDSLKNTTNLYDSLYYYTSDNPLSCSSNIRTYKYNNRILASYFYLLADLLEEKFVKPEIKEKAAETFKIVYNRITRNYTLDSLAEVINPKNT